MTYEARVDLSSQYEGGPRITTMIVKYPLMVHAEVMTHRVFSRNGASSRAITVLRNIKNVIKDPAEPYEWGSNKPGMQAGEELKGIKLWFAKRVWHTAKWAAIASAWSLMKLGCHKQVANRVLAPFQHMTLIITSTEWDNFFNLRLDESADPTMRKLAEVMKEAYDNCEVQQLEKGSWHIPMSDSFYESVANCARVSYLNHDGKSSNTYKDRKLTEHLAKDKHMSPFEHQAVALRTLNSGNFRGWTQARYYIESRGHSLEDLARELQ